MAAAQYLPSYSQHPQGRFVLRFNLFSEGPGRIDGLVWYFLQNLWGNYFAIATFLYKEMKQFAL